MDLTDDYLIGSGEVFQGFARELGQVALSDVTVLLQGESGVGKGRAARAIHRLSPRAAGPLVEVSLSALSETLIESELFGHEEGAFTGALASRSGRFRRAEGGTLVLDDVDTLPEHLQVKLLRALQERVIEPLGSESAVPIDVRVVATCSQDLGAEVRAGRFREDLYYRLAVVTLEVPPLRTRIEDLPALVEELGRRISTRAGVRPRPLSPEAMDVLREHAWPGNVRELENALERVNVLAPIGATPEVEPPPVEAEELSFLRESVDGAAERVASEILAHGLDLDAVGVAVLRKALEEHRGNVSAAARRLGMTRRAFEYRLSKLS